jgi:hypothetical protein
MARDVTAIYTDAAHARAAIVALERAGVEAGHIQLEGYEARPRPSEADLRHTDMDATGYMGRRIGTGAFIGAAIGALIGAGAGALVAALTGFSVGAAVVVGALGGGCIVGAVLGGFFGGEVSLPVDNEDFATTFEEPDVPVRLRVRVTDDGELERVEQAFEHTGATEVRRAS